MYMAVQKIVNCSDSEWKSECNLILIVVYMNSILSFPILNYVRIQTISKYAVLKNWILELHVCETGIAMITIKIV